MKLFHYTLPLFAICLVASGCINPAAKSVSMPESGAEPKVSASASPQIQAMIDKQKAILAKDPKNVAAMTQLGAAYMQVGRESADLGWYVKGRKTLESAVELDPNSASAWHTLAYAQTVFHRFPEAIETAQKAIAINPMDDAAYGVLTDAYYELGQYDKAIEACQKMIDLKPGLASFSRAAQLRWIMGNAKGALVLMQQAIDAGGGYPENTAWCRVQLGQYAFQVGAVPQAEQAFKAVLASLPGYRHALAGLGRVRASQGKLEEAAELFEKATATGPTAAHLLELADIYAKLGKRDKEQAQVARIKEIVDQQLEYGIAGNELVLATALLDHGGDKKAALALLVAEARAHDTVAAHSALAWGLLLNDRPAEAKKEVERALRTNAQDALLFYRAAAIEQALGDHMAARRFADQALSLNPGFSVAFSDAARALVASQ